MYKTQEFYTAQEERELYDRMKAGDMEAQEKLYESVIQWARKLVKRFARHLDGDQQDSFAQFSVAKALSDFDPRKGRLTTYLAYVVRSQSRHEACASVIRVPFTHYHPSLAPKDEAARLAGDIAKRVFSLDAKTRTHLGVGRMTYGELIVSREPDPALAAEEREERERMRESLKSALLEIRRRNPRAAEILVRRAAGCTLQRLGDEYGVTKESIRRTELVWTRKLKEIATRFYEQGGQKVVGLHP